MIHFYKMQYIVRELCYRWEESQLRFIMEETASSTVLTLLTATIAGKWWSAKGQLYIFPCSIYGEATTLEAKYMTHHYGKRHNTLHKSHQKLSTAEEKESMYMQNTYDGVFRL